jgi:hypothetical protein
MAKMQWTKPEVVAQIRFVEWTAENRLRHAAFLGLRSDKAARKFSASCSGPFLHDRAANSIVTVAPIWWLCVKGRNRGGAGYTTQQEYQTDRSSKLLMIWVPGPFIERWAVGPPNVPKSTSL